MKTNRTVLEPIAAARASTARTKVLTALDGFCDSEQPCIPGELLRTWHWCGARGCNCGAEFAGTASLGTSAAARVTVLEAPRSAVVTALGAVVDEDEGGPAAARAAGERLLDAIAELEEGRLVRREDDVIVPFPPDARISDPHTISYRVDGAR